MADGERSGVHAVGNGHGQRKRRAVSIAPPVPTISTEAIARRARERELRDEDRRRGEQRILAWWRQAYGALPHEDILDEQGRPLDSLMVPATRTGIVGALRLLDVHVAKDHQRLLGTFYSGSENRDPTDKKPEQRKNVPSLHQFEMANQILNALDEALHGTDERVWRAVESGLAAMVIDPRYVAIEHLKTLLAFRLQILELKEEPLRSFRRLTARTAEKEAFASLRRLHAKLGTVTDAEVFGALEGVASVEPKRGRNNKSVFVSLARLAIDRGLNVGQDIWQGAMVRRTQDAGERERAVARYAATLSQAWNQAWKRRKKNSARA